MPGIGQDLDGKWVGSTEGDDAVNVRENTFFSYANYTTNAKPPLPGQPQSNSLHEVDPSLASILASTNDYSRSVEYFERKLNNTLDEFGDGKYGGDKYSCPGDPKDAPAWCCCYDFANDWLGAQFFFPVQCIRQTNTFMIPRVASPNIAIIGTPDDGNYIEDNIRDYWSAFKKMQRHTAAWLLVPNYKAKYFDTEQDLYDYVASDKYLTPSYQGVCMGLDVDIKADNDIAMKVYFNDQSYGAGPLAFGIPDQTNPVYVPYANSPDLQSYHKYARRGFQTLQNLAATTILQKATGTPTASLSILNQPLPTETSISDPFSRILATILPFFLLIAFIPPVYNTVFHIV